MTKEEVIYVLKQEQNYLNGGPAPNIHEYEEALVTAIAVLESNFRVFESNRTRADTLRTMTDEELAEFFTMLASRQRNDILKQLHEKGLIPEVCVVEIPAMAKVAHLKWLREPAEDAP